MSREVFEAVWKRATLAGRQSHTEKELEWRVNHGLMSEEFKDQILSYMDVLAMAAWKGWKEEGRGVTFLVREMGKGIRVGYSTGVYGTELKKAVSEYNPDLSFIVLYQSSLEKEWVGVYSTIPPFEIGQRDRLDEFLI